MRKPGRRPASVDCLMRDTYRRRRFARLIYEQRGYTYGMKKTTLVLDEELLAEAQSILGTHGIKDTIDAALSEIVKQEARRQAFEQLRTMDGLDLDRDEVMASAWR